MKRIAFILALACMVSCAEPMDKLADRVMQRATVQFTQMDARLGETELPRSFIDGKCKNTDAHHWVSGFYPGSLWYVYQYTSNEAVKELAVKNTLKLQDICNLKTSHDIGFQVNCSYGNAFLNTKDTSYLAVYEQACAKLAKRYNPNVKCIRSWDWGKTWDFPVIVDNMMNLELLERGAILFACDSLSDIARNHAVTTMENHFRDNFSCYHLVDYDSATGEVRGKQTVQGYANETSWSRGQSWGLYGYTMMYDQTGDERFLAQAENIASYIIPELPEDGVPYWDFNAPGTPHAVADDAPGYPENYQKTDVVLRDASAGAIIASALVQLSTLTQDKKAASNYLKTAEKIIRTLASEEYLAAEGENGNFLLKHSVGNLHGNSEVDVPLTYADYYYLEAIVRYMAL